VNADSSWMIVSAATRTSGSGWTSAMSPHSLAAPATSIPISLNGRSTVASVNGGFASRTRVSCASARAKRARLRSRRSDATVFVVAVMGRSEST